MHFESFWHAHSDWNRLNHLRQVWQLKRRLTIFEMWHELTNWPHHYPFSPELNGLSYFCVNIPKYSPVVLIVCSTTVPLLLSKCYSHYKFEATFQSWISTRRISFYLCKLLRYRADKIRVESVAQLENLGPARCMWRGHAVELTGRSLLSSNPIS